MDSPAILLDPGIRSRRAECERSTTAANRAERDAAVTAASRSDLCGGNSATAGHRVAPRSLRDDSHVASVVP